MMDSGLPAINRQKYSGSNRFHGLKCLTSHKGILFVTSTSTLVRRSLSPLRAASSPQTFGVRGPESFGRILRGHSTPALLLSQLVDHVLRASTKRVACSIDNQIVETYCSKLTTQLVRV
jgi:hypothetical protein